jgi:RNA-directed DNA polymerase
MDRSKPAMTQSASPAPARPTQLTLGLQQHDLMEEITARANVLKAWKRVKANGGAAGIDGITIADFPAYAKDHWPRVRRALLDGTYEPQPVRRHAIPKKDGSMRNLGIPTVLDRVIQQAVLQVLTPLFDPGFSESSFGFRPGRSAHGAVKQVKRYVKQGYRVAVDLDLAKFFDRVQHDVLMVRVARKVCDRRVLKLIGRYLRAGVMVEGVVLATMEGTPQGGPLSPLLANILLDDFDKELERRGLRFARYADDLVVLVRSGRAGKRVMASITDWLGRQLRLAVNATKSKVALIDRCKFLGFAFDGAKVRLPAEALTEMKRRVRELTGRSRGISWERRLGELNRYLRGWINYFGLSETKRIWTPLDEWVRRRLRMCLWKQWRHPRTRVQHLLALGTPRLVALQTGSSRKGYWRLSKTLAAHTGMTNKWFDDQGLVRLRYRWGELAPLRRTA